MKIRYSADKLNDALAINETTETDVEVEHKTAWVMEKVYVCPRNIAVQEKQHLFSLTDNHTSEQSTRISKALKAR